MSRNYLDQIAFQTVLGLFYIVTFEVIRLSIAVVNYAVAIMVAHGWFPK